MYSPRAQSHTRWLTMLARPFRIRVKPGRQQNGIWPLGLFGMKREERAAATSVDGEILQGDRGRHASNVTELLFSDAGGVAAHRSRLTVNCKELWRHTHAHTHACLSSRSTSKAYPAMNNPHTPGHGESSQCLMWRIFSSLERLYASSQILSYLATSSWRIIHFSRGQELKQNFHPFIWNY